MPTNYTYCVDSNGLPIDKFILNNDGTVLGYNSAYYANDISLYGPSYANVIAQPIPSQCCSSLGFTYSSLTNKCYWKNDCAPKEPFKLVFAPEGNSGALFQVEENKTCFLKVSFDYLMVFDCDKLLACGQVNGTEDLEQEADVLEQELFNLAQRLVQISNTIGPYLSHNNTPPSTNDPQAQEYYRLSEGYYTTLNDYNSIKTQLNAIYSAITNQIISHFSNSTGITLNQCVTNIQTIHNQIIATDVQIAQLEAQRDSNPHQVNPDLTIQIVSLQNDIMDLEQQQHALFTECSTSSCDLVSVFSGISMSSTIESLQDIITDPNFISESPKQLVTVYEEATPFFTTLPSFEEFLNGNTNTGILFSGDNCNAVINCIKNGFVDCSIVSSDTFYSEWRHHSYDITDINTLTGMSNTLIELGIKFDGCHCDFSLLLDNIKLEKVCSVVNRSEVVINKSPGFDLVKEVDNKKSWTNVSGYEDREYWLPLRDTNYEINNPRLVINTKEIELNLDGSDAIECNVFNYIQGTDECILNYVFPCCFGKSALPDQAGCYEIFTGTPQISLTSYTVTSAATNPNYCKFGAIIYEDVSTKSFPLVNKPLSPTVIIDSTGGTVHVSGSVLSDFWGSGSTSSGRLNGIGVWATSMGTPYNEWIGFSACISADTEQQYFIGIGADNELKVKLNGELIIYLSASTTFNFNYWHIFPLILPAGNSIIELEGLNTRSVASFGAEIYTTDIDTLTGSTTTATTNTIFSTINYLGIPFDIGDNSGYICPTGYFLNKCSGTVFCEYIEYSDYDCKSVNQLLSTPFSSVTTYEDFIEVFTTELIDVKDRKVLGAYPTLRYIYDSYYNPSDYGCPDSLGYNYCLLNNFITLIGNYWVDIVEQLIPATTIWGSTYVYRNTMFDQTPFKYKKGTLYYCDEVSFSSGTTGVTFCDEMASTTYANVIITDLSNSITGNCITTEYQSFTCDRLSIVQVDDGSEFRGTISYMVIPNNSTSGSTNNNNTTNNVNYGFSITENLAH